ncbi:MAG: T9SS type A sorting domain-containing protein [candidate division Zixibacteria bacterium]|nr:T9SS type A sorting domain-containing protein [candidate division Zixibacteria bacterium]
MKTFILILGNLFILTTAIVNAEPGDTLWTKTYGGIDWDRAESIRQTDDGGYIMAGFTESYGGGGRDFYLIKTDSEGNSLWSETYGGVDRDEALSVQQTSDGGYIVGGLTESYGAGAVDFYLIKTDSDGNTVWTKTYGGSDSDYGYSVRQTNDGGYIFAGYSESFGAGAGDMYLVKTNSAGDTLWTRAFGGTDYEGASSVQQTADGGYIVAGHTNSFGAGDYDCYLVKTDSAGNPQWTGTYGAGTYEIAQSVHQTFDGGYILAGYSNNGDIDFYVVKIDSDGDAIWSGIYGQNGGADEFAFCVRQTLDGGYIVAGRTTNNGDDFYLVKTNSGGDTLWTRTYGGNQAEVALSVRQTDDGSYIAAGQTNSYGFGDYDVYVVKIEAGDFTPCCDVDMTPDDDPVIVPPGGSFGFTGYIGNPTENPIVTDVWGGVIYQGNFYQQFSFPNISLNPGQSMSAHSSQNVPGFAPAGTYDYIAYCGDRPDEICDQASFPFTVSGALLSDGAVEWSIEGEFFGSSVIPSEYSLDGNYPNPFNASTSIAFSMPDAGDISLQVYNLMGQKIATLAEGYKNAGRHTVTWEAADYSSGIYFYKLTAGDEVLTRRMTLLK